MYKKHYLNLLNFISINLEVNKNYRANCIVHIVVVIMGATIRVVFTELDYFYCVFFHLYVKLAITKFERRHPNYKFSCTLTFLVGPTLVSIQWYHFFKR